MNAKSLSEKIADAEANASRHLADFNELNERGRGNSKKAQEHCRKGQYWLDRANVLRGWN